MINREEAYQLVTTWIENKNLIKHMLCVEAAMGELAKHFGENENLWKIVGLLHDADYDKYPDSHPQVLIDELEKRKEDRVIIDAIKAHAWRYNNFDVEPKTKMEWSLYCCDELTGLIVAVALIRPEKKLSAVTVENVLSKWTKKDFAKGVNRDQIDLCEEKLGIKLPDFIEIILKSMQSIATDLGL
ncbi:MAG: HDIG protein [uncultured bacterium]|nr:MAG: HDIG protein [uncultured bacterium]